MFYTDEQLKRLEKYKKTFETAINAGFARNVGSIALKEIEQVYDEALGQHYNYNSGCSVCVLHYLKRVGTPFLREYPIYVKKEVERLKQEMEQQQEETPVQEEKPKIKRTRKKKEENGTE